MASGKHIVDVDGRTVPPCIVMTYPNKDFMIEASIALRQLKSLAGNGDLATAIADMSNNDILRILRAFTDMTAAIIGNVTAADVKEYLAKEVQQAHVEFLQREIKRPSPGDAFSAN